MKKVIPISCLVLLCCACAETQQAFDPAAAFQKAEERMKDEDFEKARTAYQEIQEKSPERAYDSTLMLRIADTYFGEEKYEEALVEYRAFLNYHPANKEAPYAQYQVALCSYNQMSSIDRDPGLTRSAIREFDALLAKYPGSPYDEKARTFRAICVDRLAQYELYVAKFYHRKGSYRSALDRLEELIARYPGASSEKEALYLAGSAHLAVGEREQGKAKLEKLIRLYPSMTEDAEALLRQHPAL